jgi:hypothetical protein
VLEPEVRQGDHGGLDGHRQEEPEHAEGHEGLRPDLLQGGPEKRQQREGREEQTGVPDLRHGDDQGVEDLIHGQHPKLQVAQ